MRYKLLKPLQTNLLHVIYNQQALLSMPIFLANHYSPPLVRRPLSAPPSSVRLHKCSNTTRQWACACVWLATKLSLDRLRPRCGNIIADYIFSHSTTRTISIGLDLVRCDGPTIPASRIQHASQERRSYQQALLLQLPASGLQCCTCMSAFKLLIASISQYTQLSV